MSNHHEPLQALEPVDWDQVPKGDDLCQFLQSVFDRALLVVDSVPSSASTAPSEPVGRLRAKTESAVNSTAGQRLPTLESSQKAIEAAQRLQKDWKEVKINPRDNPRSINVFKLAAKDGKGSWFARQSVHEELSFDDWKLGLKKEFAETMKVQGAPGSGSIRGIGADKAVEHIAVDSAGELDIFQLSAQFPGPTSPRDFVTLLLTSDLSYRSPDTGQPLRQYIVVSKPCLHEACPTRPGIIRGQYESVEIIREVPIDRHTSKRSQSSTDLRLPGDRRSLQSSATPNTTTDDTPAKQHTAVEWLMVTRSDPGGSVPRFLIEKGTPPGIVGDAGKFMSWVIDNAARGFADAEPVAADAPKDATNENTEQESTSQATPTIHVGNNTEQTDYAQDEPMPNSNGIYGILAGIFGAASTVVPTSLIQTFSGSLSNGGSDIGSLSSAAIPEEDESSFSDDSSVQSFTSAIEKRLTAEKEQVDTLLGEQSEDSRSISSQPMNKELRKLHERRQKLERKLSEMQTKRLGEKEKDEASMNKKREKHEKEVAKQEEKYNKELRKLEEKKEQEARRAERRRRKTIEKEQKSNLGLEVDRLRAERDLAVKHAQLLQDQVRELQNQNTMLVAKLGRLGVIDGSELSKAATSSI